MRILVDQLEHRGVFRAAYHAAGAWLVVQIATAVFSFLEFPNFAEPDMHAANASGR